MNIQLKYLGLIILVSAAIGGYMTRQFAPRTIVKTNTVTQTVDHDVIKDHVVTITKEIDKKDGTKEIDTEVVDNRVNNDNSTTNTKTQTVSSTPIPVPQANWFVSAGAGVQADSISNLSKPIYEGSVNRRILGPIYFGVTAHSDGYVGAQLGLQF